MIGPPALVPAVLIYASKKWLFLVEFIGPSFLIAGAASLCMIGGEAFFDVDDGVILAQRNLWSSLNFLVPLFLSSSWFSGMITRLTIHQVVRGILIFFRI